MLEEIFRTWEGQNPIARPFFFVQSVAADHSTGGLKPEMWWQEMLQVGKWGGWTNGPSLRHPPTKQTWALTREAPPVCGTGQRPHWAPAPKKKWPTAVPDLMALRDSLRYGAALLLLFVAHAPTLSQCANDDCTRQSSLTSVVFWPQNLHRDGFAGFAVL